MTAVPRLVKTLSVVVVVLGTRTGVNGFINPQPSVRPDTTTTTTTTTTTMDRTTTATTTAIQQAAGLPSFTGYDSFARLRTLTNVPSGEEQRKLRRTVYTHDDWKKHRSQDRFIVYLAAIFKSGVYKNLANEVFLATFIATFVCVYNAIVGGYTDFGGINHPGLIQISFLPKVGLPMQAFTLTSPSLGLLLGKWT